MRSAVLGCLSGLVVVCVAPSAMAQDYPNARYYLHRGSTYQYGCWGPCACPLTNREPMHGSFDLRLVTIGDVTDQYAVTNVDWRVPRIAAAPANVVITGSGTFAAGQEPFAHHQGMSLQLTITPPPFGAEGVSVQSAFGDRTVPPPAIRIEVASSTLGCPGVRMQLVATPLRSDWNADARVSIQDLFDFVADYFQGRGDHNGDGATSVQDIFDFLADWFAGA